MMMEEQGYRRCKLGSAGGGGRAALAYPRGPRPRRQSRKTHARHQKRSLQRHKTSDGVPSHEGQVAASVQRQRRAGAAAVPLPVQQADGCCLCSSGGPCLLLPGPPPTLRE